MLLGLDHHPFFFEGFVLHVEVIFSCRNTYTMKEGHIAHLMKMLETAYGTYIKPKSARDEQMKDIMNWTIECISHSDIITIFDIRR